MKLANRIVRNFAFFNERISDKYGKKCCRYHQDGKPMKPERVEKTYEELKSFLDGWRVGDSSLSLYRYFYAEDYPMAVQFLKDIAKIDALQFKNCPGFEFKKGEVLKIELQSPPLAGLSQIDFQLAMKINNLKFDEYSLLPITDINNYKMEVMKIRMKRKSEEIQRQLQEDLGKDADEKDTHVHTDKCNH